MREVAIILALFVCASAIPTEDLEWKLFKTKYNKHYSPQEDIRRYKIYLETKIKIAEHKKIFDEGLVTFTMGVNKFADMLPEETKYLRGYREVPNGLLQEGSFFQPDEGTSYPDSVDWRKEGYVTPVKDQGACGSCWAFSATGSLEGQNFKKTGKLVSLSEQNLVDCTKDCGCSGGHVISAFTNVIVNGGIDTEDSYPYDARDERCKFNSCAIGGTCKSFKMTKPFSEADLLAATATVGPISVAIDASGQSFFRYKDGVHYDPNCSNTTSNLNHSVLVVGYGTQDGQDYWLVKNSWGSGWGKDGYIMMARNRNNNCGIATEPSYPLV